MHEVALGADIHVLL